MDQMTIYDLLPDEPRPDFHTMTEEQVANYLSDVLGVTFTWNDHLEEYTAHLNTQNYGKFFLEFHLSKYNTKASVSSEKNGKTFLSCGAIWTHGGSGSPCDSLEEAIKFYKRYI